MKKFFLSLVCIASLISIFLILIGMFAITLFVFTPEPTEPGWFAERLLNITNLAGLLFFSPFVFFMRKTRQAVVSAIISFMEKINILPE